MGRTSGGSTPATARSTTWSFISRSFSLSSRGTEGVQELKGPLGLTTLYEPNPKQTRALVADVVFVHGLNGGSFSTWSKGNNPDCYWPQQWLPKEDGFGDVRIHAFGYPAAATRASVLNIGDISQTLLAAIHDLPSMRQGKQPPLIFVAHNRVCAIFFLATPHQGAAIAQVLSRLTTMIGGRPFVEDLFPQSPLIQSLTKNFPQECNTLQLFSFYETRPMSVGVYKMLIVEKSSAVMNLPNERQAFLEADHRNVAMYATPADSSYRSVRNALATVIASQRQVATAEECHVLDRFLGVSAAPEDHLIIQESTKLPRSCEWLISKKCYQSWRELRGSAFLWLQGRPGAGKSVLSSHVIGDLRNQGLDCCFFFFQARDSVKSTVNSCLRSMAWQMAMLHPNVFDKLKTLMSECQDSLTDKIESHSVWQRTFVSGILQVELDKPQFWVIDAMDECKGAGDMTAFLTRIQEHWPLSVLVTSRDAVENRHPGTDPHVSIQSYTISEQDSLQDISLLLEANLAHLPCPASDRWPTPEKLASQILERSAGCFLWASLMCSELRQVTSEKEITSVMDSTPADMDAVYSDILARMDSTRFGKETTRAILAWATYAFRPLHLAEMQTAIEMNVDDKIGDAQHVISKGCGSLLYVDQHDRVQLVHLTAREFLTRGQTKSALIVTKPEAHRRLAFVCLKSVLQLSQNPAGRSEKPGSVSNTRPVQSTAPFIHYASKFLFQHLDHVDSADDELLLMLSSFLGSRSLLIWIEFIAANGDLRTVYDAGKIIKTLSRRAWHPSPAAQGLSLSQGEIDLLEKWGEDMVHLVPQFGERLRRSPKAIYHHIAPFCPPDSAIRQEFASPMRGISVQGLSSRSWDDCLTTLRYSHGRSLSSVVTAPGYLAVGIAGGEGQVIVYDDAIFQEIHTIYHGEHVGGLAFAESGKYLASLGGKTVRVWSPATGLELASFELPLKCASLRFAKQDTILRVVMERNHFVEWDIESNAFVQGEPRCWGADLPERMQGRLPTQVWLSPNTNLLAALYQGHDIIFWDCAEMKFYDVYEQKTGSVQMFGSQLQARAADTKLFAATFDDGDLVVFDLDIGKPIAVNTERTYNLVLASSHNGRTLAGVDQMGNLTLFEFKTLRLLYRVRLEASTLPWGLTFTGDDLRVIETCRGQSRVWEPPVLRSHNTQHHCASLTELKPMGPRDMYRDCQARRAQEITAMTCSHGFSVVFYAMGDGSVFGYDISRPEPEKKLLTSRDSVGDRPALDRGSKIRPRPRHVEAGSCVFETPEAALVLLVPGLHLSLDGFCPLSHANYFATYATDTSASERTSTSKETAAILLWDFQDLEGTDSQPVAPRWEIRTSMLPAQVAHLIGAFGTRLVFHTADHWIASFELMPPGSPSGAIVAEDSFVRHFFLPNDWIGSMKLSDMLFGISSEGEIIFDRRGELAVIKRGLELTEDGGPFQPRQLSSTSRAQFGHKIPYRQPGMSVTCWLQTKDSGCVIDREG
ncbi:hypothetical protein C8A01DRAFT_50681 [Parachaetomium inaequale]|uniref:NACHT domain-containing protein n=1 Tax=Parachaetomium inaequale TaxID=2588326 RepID=A0AAN6SM99_9PEZI|nr:hypothetical protein C8A01DRAFT_50681 [Parachaetomium inaequale]